MALWFAQSDGPVTPARVGKRCVTPGRSSVVEPAPQPTRTLVAPSSSGATTDRATYSTSANHESATMYCPSGRRRLVAPHATAIVPEQFSGRETYTHTPWEHEGKRIIAPARVEPKQRPITPRKAQPAPYGTYDVKDIDVPKTRFQKKHVDTHLSKNSEGEADYLKKRSRTPPASTPSRCPTEGFCVLYSSRPAEGGLVQYMSMVDQMGHGKSSKIGEKNFMDNREASVAKDARIMEYKRRVQVDRNSVIRPDPAPTGIRRPATPRTTRLETPYAINLPTLHDDIGISVSRSQRIKRA